FASEPKLLQCMQCPHVIPHAQREGLFNETFGRITTAFKTSEDFQNLRSELLESDEYQHANFMRIITTIGTPLFQFPKRKSIEEFDIGTEMQYRGAATKFVSGLYDKISYTHLCEAGKNQIFRAALSAFLCGYDEIVAYFTACGVRDSQEHFGLEHI